MIHGEKTIIEKIDKRMIDNDLYLYILPEGFNFWSDGFCYGRLIYEDDEVYGEYWIKPV